jgi:hypothetical protein
VTEALSETEMLRLAAPAFTIVWLNDILEHLSNPQIPEVQNTDGDALTFCTVHFRAETGKRDVLELDRDREAPLAEGATENDICSVLGKLPMPRSAATISTALTAIGAAIASQPPASCGNCVRLESTMRFASRSRAHHRTASCSTALSDFVRMRVMASATLFVRPISTGPSVDDAKT